MSSNQKNDKTMANYLTTHTNETFTTASGKTIRYEDIFVGIDNEVGRYERQGGKEMRREDLEDLRQDACKKAVVASKGSYDPAKSKHNCPEAYGAAIARRCERDAYSKSVKWAQRFTAFACGDENEEGFVPREISGYRGDEFEADRELRTKEAMSYIRGKMAKLGESLRSVLELSMEEYTTEEISKILGCTTSAVYTRLCKARKALAATLGHEFLAQYGYKLSA